MNTKIAAIFASLIFALASTGVAFSLFTTPAYVYTTVNTGTLSAEWRVDSQEFLRIHRLIVPSYVTIAGNRGPDNEYTATLTVENFYPGAVGVVGLELLNTGSLPYKVKSTTITVTSDPGSLLRGVLYFGIPETTGLLTYPINVRANYFTGTVISENTLAGWDGYTLDYASASIPQTSVAPGQWIPLYAYLRMDSGASIDYADKSLTFTITVIIEQAV